MATDALALAADELNHDGMDGMDGMDGSAEQPAKAGASKVKAAAKPRHGTRKSDKPHLNSDNAPRPEPTDRAAMANPR